MLWLKARKKHPPFDCHATLRTTCQIYSCNLQLIFFIHLRHAFWTSSLTVSWTFNICNSDLTSIESSCRCHLARRRPVVERRRRGRKGQPPMSLPCSTRIRSPSLKKPLIWYLKGATYKSILSPEAELCARLQMLVLWTTNQHAEIFFTAISLDAHNNNIRNLAQDSASG